MKLLPLGNNCAWHSCNSNWRKLWTINQIVLAHFSTWHVKCAWQSQDFFELHVNYNYISTFMFYIILLYAIYQDNQWNIIKFNLLSFKCYKIGCDRLHLKILVSLLIFVISQLHSFPEIAAKNVIFEALVNVSHEVSNFQNNKEWFFNCYNYMIVFIFKLHIYTWVF